MSQAVRVRLKCDYSCSYRSEGCGEHPHIGSDVKYQRNSGGMDGTHDPMQTHSLLEDFTAGSESWLFRI